MIRRITYTPCFHKIFKIIICLKHDLESLAMKLRDSTVIKWILWSPVRLLSAGSATKDLDPKISHLFANASTNFAKTVSNIMSYTK